MKLGRMPMEDFDPRACFERIESEMSDLIRAYSDSPRAMLMLAALGRARFAFESDAADARHEATLLGWRPGWRPSPVALVPAEPAGGWPEQRWPVGDDEIRNAATEKSKRSGQLAWDRATLAKWGVPWPPPKGWRKRILEDGVPYRA